MQRRKRHGRRLAHLAERAVVRLAVAVLRRFPARAAAGVLDRLRPTTRLDYPRADIVLGVPSTAAFHRASACRKEPETVEWIETSVEPGDVLYDIGANVGAYSLVAWAATGGAATVVAFEPGFSTYAALVENVRLNRCGERVIPLQVALSDVTRLTTLHYSGTAPGAALHRLGDGEGFDAELRQAVPCYRLDRLVEELGLPRPNHLKIDVDGSETRVLRGAGALLDDAAVRTVLIEVDESAEDHGEISRHLRGKGFRERARHPRGPSGTLFNVLYGRSSSPTEG